jgi:hypothetical protein
MNVRQLLELQRAFECDRVADAAAQEQRVFFRGEAFGPDFDLGFEIQRVLDAAG